MTGPLSRRCRSAVQDCLDAVFGLVRTVRLRGPLNPPRGLREKILVILLEGLGDGLVFTPAFRALRRTYPASEIDLLVNDRNYEIYKDLTDTGRLIRWPGSSRLGGRTIAIVRRLRSGRYDTVITPSPLFRHVALACGAGASARVGFDWKGRGAFLDFALPLDRGKSRIHCHLDLVASIGAFSDDDSMDLRTDSEDLDDAGHLLGQSFGPPGGPAIVVHPGTMQEVNRWPAGSYALLADRLDEELGARVFFTGSPSDVDRVEEIRSTAKSDTISLAGETNLRQLAAVFRRCDLVVSPDTGAMHVGAAVGAPMVILMGGRNDPVEWAPLSENVRVIRKDVPCSPCRRSYCRMGTPSCMETIEVGEVVEEVCRLFRLSEHGHRSRLTVGAP